MSEIKNKQYAELYEQAKRGAISRKILFQLTRDEFYKLVDASEGCCQVTGIVFNGDYINQSQRRPWYPSLDRINSRAGYAFNNCRLVCAAVNIGMNEWGEGVIQEITKSMQQQNFKRLINAITEDTMLKITSQLESMLKNQMVEVVNSFSEQLFQRMPILQSMPSQTPSNAIPRVPVIGDVIRPKNISAIVGLSRSTIWRLERDGAFPQKIKLTRNAVGWRRADIESWLNHSHD